MSKIKTVAVYLGSRTGKGPEYVNNACRLGRLLAENGIKIVYGGASVGTMKALADGCFAAGGHITGVFPSGFKGKRDNAAAGFMDSDDMNLLHIDSNPDTLVNLLISL